MKKTIVGLILILIFVFAVQIYLRRETAKITQEIAPSPTSVAPSPVSLRRLINEPRTAFVSEDGNCAEFFSEIEKIDLEDLGFPPKLQKLPTSTSCTSASPQFLKLLKMYQDKCAALIAGVQQPLNEDEWKKETGECLGFVYYARAGITAQHLHGKKLSEISDLKTLTDLLADAFGHFMTGDPNGEILDVSKRILEIDPRIYGANKAAIVGMLVNADHSGASPEYWSSARDYLAQVEASNPNDPEIPLMRTLIDTNGMEPNHVKSLAEKMLAAQPTSNAYELLGYADWYLGDHSASFAALQRAIDLDPSNAGLKDLWKAIHDPNAGAHSYKLNQNISVNLSDMLK